ncbi:MAG: tetratricopeptide repeat protein [Bacteroidota bacterium]
MYKSIFYTTCLVLQALLCNVMLQSCWNAAMDMAQSTQSAPSTALASPGTDAEDQSISSGIDALYANLRQAIQRQDLRMGVPQVISRIENLDLFDMKTAPRTEIARHYMISLRKDQGAAWCRTASGQAVLSQLEYIIHTEHWSSELRSGAAYTDRLTASLGELASLHQKQAQVSGDPRYYTDAAICYQHILQACEKYPQATQAEAPADHSRLLHDTYQHLAQIRSTLGARSITTAELQAEIQRDRYALHQLRADMQDRLDNVSQTLKQLSTPDESSTVERRYVEGSAALFDTLSTNISNLLAQFYRESVEELGSPPCPPYAVIGLGPMARKKVTPYSSLSIAMLIAISDQDPMAPFATSYLQRLCHLVNLRIINLGETPLSRDRYGIHLAHLVRPGFRLNLAHNLSEAQVCPLIQPVSGMMGYLASAEHTSDNSLAHLLENTCYLYGDLDLYTDYTARQHAWISKPANYLSRALDRLHQGAAAYKYGQAPALEFIVRASDELYSLQQGLYLLLDWPLYDLALYYGQPSTSVWDAIDHLANQAIINPTSAHHLRYAASFSGIFWLQCQIHASNQACPCLITQVICQSSLQLTLSKMCCLPVESPHLTDSLVRCYYTILPLYEKVRAFLQTQAHEDRSIFFQEESLYDDSDAVKGALYTRLLQPATAQAHYTSALVTCQNMSPGPNCKIASLWTDLGDACQVLQQYPAALQHYTDALDMYQRHFKDSHDEIARLLYKLGSACLSSNDYQQSREYYAEALSIHLQSSTDSCPEIAHTLDGLGTTWHLLGDYQQSRGHYERALSIYRHLYVGAHPHILRMLSKLGHTCAVLNNYGTSLIYAEQALSMCQCLYTIFHPQVGRAMHNVARVRRILGHNQWSACDEQALFIYQHICLSCHSSFDQVLHYKAKAAAAYKACDVQATIANHEQALSLLTDQADSIQEILLHNLACMYHVAALSAIQEANSALSQTYFEKAKTTFESACQHGNREKTSLYTNYARLLLSMDRLEEAYTYLRRVVFSDDHLSSLCYGRLEKEALVPLLHAWINMASQVEMKSIDYAYYLLIHNYTRFQQAGISLDMSPESYLASYIRMLNRRVREDLEGELSEMGHILLESLCQELGYPLVIRPNFLNDEE